MFVLRQYLVVLVKLGFNRGTHIVLDSTSNLGLVALTSKFHPMAT